MVEVKAKGSVLPYFLHKLAQMIHSNEVSINRFPINKDDTLNRLFVHPEGHIQEVINVPAKSSHSPNIHVCQRANYFTKLNKQRREQSQSLQPL